MIRLDAWPARAMFVPGERADLRVVARGAPGERLGVMARCSEGGHPMGATAPQGIALDDEGYGEVCLSLDLPLTDRERAAYAMEIVAVGDTQEARTTTALDVAQHWSRAPRYGFLCDFPPYEPEHTTAERADALARLHLNVVQCYDWMATHHTFLPETDPFVDPLGRRMSHTTLRRLLSLCRDRGIAPLAYGALYGAEREFSAAHESWLLYGADRAALHLGELFYLQDPSPGSPWREWIIGQYEEAVRALGFDGIHIDQYGFPKRALSRATGQWCEVDLAQVFPGFVEEACRRVRQLAPNGGSIFNCVNAWPLEALGSVQGDAATYIEVWEPHSTYRDLYELARRARSLRPGKPVILAAYLAPFGATSRSAGALTAFRLAFAAIHASGATQLIAGENGAVLTEGYYPRYARLDGAELGVVRRSYDFLVRNGPLLLEIPADDLAWTHVGPTNGIVTLAHPSIRSYGAGPDPDRVWTVLREGEGRSALQLVNLCGLQEERWNVAHERAPDVLEDVDVTVRVVGDVDGVYWDTPDDDVGGARPLPFEVTAGELRFRLPRLEVWDLVWWETRSGRS